MISTFNSVVLFALIYKFQNVGETVDWNTFESCFSFLFSPSTRLVVILRSWFTSTHKMRVILSDCKLTFVSLLSRLRVICVGSSFVCAVTLIDDRIVK